MDADRPRISQRAALGWRAYFAQQMTAEEAAAGWVPARVCRVQARRCRVWLVPAESGAGEGVDPPDEQNLAVALFGEAGLPGVGDWVLVDPAAAGRPRRLERFSVLTRRAPGSRVQDQVLAANVDTLLVVTACNEEFSVGRIERYLALAAGAGPATRPIRAVVVLTKADLADDAERYAAAARRLGEGMPGGLRVEVMDARDPEQVARLGDLCGSGQTVAVLGSSGVGKSTLINAISDAQQKTGAVRGDDNKGKHTTTSRSLHRLRAGGVIVDLPGIRELQLADGGGLDVAFAEAAEVAARCRFSNCRHTGEPGCAVAVALAQGMLDPRRWENYRKLLAEQAGYLEQRSRQDRRANRRLRPDGDRR